MEKQLPLHFFKKYKDAFEGAKKFLDRDPTEQEMYEQLPRNKEQKELYNERMEIAYQYMTDPTAHEIGEDNEFKIELRQSIVNYELKKARIRKGLTQKELSIAIGEQSQLITALETFKRMPNEKQIESLSKVLECDARKLFPEWLKFIVDERKNKRNIILEVGRIALDAPDVLQIEAPEEQQEQSDRVMLKKMLKPHIEKLSPRTQKILDMRFGLTDGVSHTLEEVGQEFGVTRDRIRQIEAKALEEIKRELVFQEKITKDDYLYG